MNKNKVKANYVNKKTKVTKFYFASFWKRILVRFLDWVFLLSIFLIFLLLTLVYQANNNFLEAIKKLFLEQNIIIASWRFLLFWFILLIISFFYFVVIVYYTKGYTLFSWIFKLRTYNKQTYEDNLFPPFKNLIFRELVISFLFLIINFLMAITLLIFKPENSWDFFIKIIKRENQNTQLLQILGIIFSTLLSFVFVIISLFFFNTIYYSKKITWQDRMGPLVIVDLSNNSKNKKNKPKISQKNYQELVNWNKIKNLPGTNINDEK